MAETQFSPWNLPEEGEEGPSEAVVEETPTEDTPVVEETPVVEDAPVEEAPVEEVVQQPSAEELKAGPLGLQYGITDGEIDRAKLTTPISRAVAKIPVLGQIDQFGSAAGQGVGDFIFDFAGMIGLRGADDWWDKHNPKSDDAVHTLIRDASAIIVPSIVGGSVIKGVGVATKARHISSAQRTLGNILAYMGLDVSVAAISSQSYEQDNMIGAINSITGLNIPGGTTPDMNPDVRRHYHILESAGFSLGIDLLGAVVAFGKKVRAKNLDPKAFNLREQEFERINKIWQSNGTDPITEAVESRKAIRDDEILRETGKRLRNADNVDYDPFINEPHRVEQRAVDPDSFDVNANLAKGDLYQIQNNKGSVDGIMRPSAHPSFLDSISAAENTTERAKSLGRFFEDSLSANADIDLLGETIPAAKLNEAVDKLTENLFNNQITFKQYKKIINTGKTRIFEGRKFLSDDAWIAADKAWTKAHRELFDPNNLRSSAMLSQQAADVISTTSKSLELLDGIGTSSRQWELISKKMKFLVSEVNASNEVVKRSNELKELVKANDPEKLASWLNNQSDSFNSMLNASKRKSFNIIDEIERIAKEQPDWVRPLAEAYDATNGDVDSLYKLHKWTENNIGFFKKAFFDRAPEMPSKIIQGLHSLRYQNILNGMAPVRALVGNSIISTIKPISVFAGAAATGDVGTFKRALYVYGGLTENFKRGFKVLGDDWRRANNNPLLSAKRGRHDIKQSTFADLEAMDTVAEAWRKEGKDGKVMMWNIGKTLTHWSNWKIQRWGITSLYSIDGFLKSLMASGNARAQAYDTLFEATNGSFKRQQFEDLQRHLYDNAFHPDGTLKSAAAEFDTKEIALNLDNKFVERFELMANHIPAMKALFMFPRTGANAFELGWSFNPISNLGPGITRAQRALRASSPEEIAEVMMEHGRPNTVAAFKALQSEYIGRQLMGTSAVIGAGMWALEGNLTGNGPQDKAERRRMLNMGWKPKSIKNPITGRWHSYEGLEPIEGLLGLVGDMVYQAERYDQSISEDWFNKVVAAITLNIGNDTLAGGLEPLVSLYSGNEGAWNRFLANQANMMIPQAGMRTILNNIWTPQLKDVENEFLAQLANKNKFAFRGDSRFLPDMKDAYTGDPIRFYEPINAAANALLPFLKQNGGMEPWRQWLLQTGWDGLSTPRTNTISGGPLSRWERQWINNWIGQHAGLKEQIIVLMGRDDDQWTSELMDYKKRLGITGQQRDTPIKKLLLHRELDRIHERAFRNAYRRLKVYYRETGGTELIEGRMRQVIEERLKKGDTKGAFDYRDQLLKLNK